MRKGQEAASFLNWLIYVIPRIKVFPVQQLFCYSTNAYELKVQKLRWRLERGVEMAMCQSQCCVGRWTGKGKECIMSKGMCVCPFLRIGDKICGLKWECMENMQCIDLGILIMVL